MKKTLLSLTMLLSFFAVAHEHEEMNLVNPTVYKNQNAIVQTVELGKTDDGDYGMELHDFETSFELEKVNNVYFTEDLRVRAKEEDGKLVNELVIPFFDRSLFNTVKYKRGFDFHSFEGAAHMHAHIDVDKKQIDLNGKVYDVVISGDEDVAVYTEKNGKFVFTTYVDQNNRIQAFATLISTSVYNK
ncbi:hypothetical protein [Oceanivirga miroungae]|uniref:Uncharacterized protein n=1 Tax=Oceanivirga miroungae TaxID=1130046 RepID=A0A6I8MAC4_9FUSO|nr:hypothetical protein [Oceanivirga miroungae]VWL85112.1 hypothetical protein OMES3154_00394 [Oceanivirga miroungae]